MISKYAKIDFNKCSPEGCGAKVTGCMAGIACSYRLLEQEDVDDPPMLMSPTMCVGCGDCVRACPLAAIGIDRA